MSDLISKQAAIDALEQQAREMSRWSERYAEQTKGVLTAINVINDLTSAQPERKTGQWIFEERKRLVDETDDGSVYRTEKWWSCSECGYAKGYQISKPSSNYCENCGAKMRKSGEE